MVSKFNDESLFKNTLMTLLIAHNFSACRDQIGTDNCLNYIKFDDGCNPDSRHYPYVIANCRMSCGECELSAGGELNAAVRV